ncbi:MAG: AIR synthase-related protein, partial [Cyanobacteria bacterium P01_D01_bin.1]
TPVVGMVGLIPDLTKVCGQGWRSAGDLIYLLGVEPSQTKDGVVTLGGSEYLKQIHQTVAGKPPVVDVQLELSVQAACRHGIRQGWIQSAHDCAEGGIAIALSESCISATKGAKVELAAGDLRLDTLLFGEGGARILVSVANADRAKWEAYCQEQGVDCSLIGTVGEANQPLEIKVADDETSLISVSVEEMEAHWGNAIANALENAPETI